MPLSSWIPFVPVPCLLADKDTGLIIAASPAAIALGYVEGNIISTDCLVLLHKPNSELVRDGRAWDITASDTPQGVLVIATEITSLRSENKRIASKLHNKEYFMGRLLRHDLTSPLATISYLLDKVEKTGDQDYLKKASKSVSRVISIVERSGYLFGKGGGKKEVVKAVDIIRECVDDLELSIKQSQSKVEIIGNGTMLYGEVVRLRQVFLNLISNALKFKSPNRESQITITVTKLDKITSIEVKDNGIGIPGIFFDEIFTPTKKLHSRVEFEGEGLGLAIAKEIIEEHLGKITIHSKVDVGTAFTVWLPFYDNTPTTPN